MNSIELKLSLQRALLGEITDNLVAVTSSLNGTHIKIVAYFKGNLSEEDIERVQDIGTEVIADFPEPYTIEEVSLSADEHGLQCLDFWAFKRAI